MNKQVVAGVCKCGAVEYIASLPISDETKKDLIKHLQKGGELKFLPIDEAKERFGGCKCP